MFDFRADKTGFFVTIILLALLGVAIGATLAVFLAGFQAALFWIVLKWIWGTWWVLTIITVLTRLAIFRWQMIRASRKSQSPESPTDREPTPQT
jgi:hypothetical protein